MKLCADENCEASGATITTTISSRSAITAATSSRDTVTTASSNRAVDELIYLTKSCSDNDHIAAVAYAIAAAATSNDDKSSRTVNATVDASTTE